MKWSVVYEKAIKPDGSLLFPEKLSMGFLESAKKTMGSYVYSNQYLNEIIPAELQTFKQAWFKYFTSIPDVVNTFIFIDPALSEADTSDYTGVVVVSVDPEKNWYVKHAKRYRINPTELVSFVFELNKQFRPNVIAIEEIAYQKALLYFLDEEMRRRDVILPVKGIRYPNQNSKQTRILSLVPRFEWGHVLMGQGFQDLELELLTFPRGAHDDLIDALAGIEYIYYPPAKPSGEIQKPSSPASKDYERWYIQNLAKRDQQFNE